MKKRVKDCKLGNTVVVRDFKTPAILIADRGDGWYCAGWIGEPESWSSSGRTPAWIVRLYKPDIYKHKADGFEDYVYGWWVHETDEVELVSSTEPKTNPAPPPAKAEQLELPKQAVCSCRSWSRYTGLKHECASCRGTSSLDRRLAAAGRLEEIALTLSGYGELTACQELMDLAATIRTVGLE